MKIVAVEAGIVSVPLQGTFISAHGALQSQSGVLVRICDDEGGVGWGGVDPIPGYSAVSAAGVVQDVNAGLGPALIGSDPGNVLGALHHMDRCLEDGFEAKAAVETALIDLKGKRLGVTAASLLGGRVRDRVWLNAWIGLVSPERAAAEAVQWCEQGFRSAKVKVGTEFQTDVDRVAAVRTRVGAGMQLRVDANESLTVEQAIRLAKALEPYDISLLEQPVPRHDIAALAEVRRHSRLPIMADESVQSPASLVEIIKQEAADLVKLKVMKQGGMIRTLHMAAMAEAAGLKVVIGHGFGLWVSTLAEACVAAVSSAIIDGCESVGPLKMSGDVVKDPPRIEQGGFALPNTPGLGVELDEQLLKRYGW